MMIIVKTSCYILLFISIFTNLNQKSLTLLSPLYGGRTKATAAPPYLRR